MATIAILNLGKVAITSSRIVEFCSNFVNGYKITHHRRNVSFSSVNGDMAFLFPMGMVKIWHLAESNLFTDCDITMHNWLNTRDQHATQNLYKSVDSERLGKYVKHIALFSLFSASEMTYIVSSGALNSTHLLTSLLFFTDSPTALKWPVGGFWRTGSKHVESRMDVPLGSTQWPTTFKGSDFWKTVKIEHERAIASVLTLH